VHLQLKGKTKLLLTVPGGACPAWLAGPSFGSQREETECVAI
jgi:hypothetical protein